MQEKWCLLAGADKHVVDNGEELHDSLVQVQVLQALEQVWVSAHTQQDHRWAVAEVISSNLVFYVQSVISGRLSSNTDSNQAGLKNKRNLISFGKCSLSFNGLYVWNFATCQSVKIPPPPPPPPLCLNLKPISGLSSLDRPFQTNRQTISASTDYVCVCVHACEWMVCAWTLSFCSAKKICAT